MFLIDRKSVSFNWMILCRKFKYLMLIFFVRVGEERGAKKMMDASKEVSCFYHLQQDVCLHTDVIIGYARYS